MVFPIIIEVINMNIVTFSVVKLIITLKSRVRGAVSPVIPANYRNGRFLADILHTKCQPFPKHPDTPGCKSGLPFNTMNCTWGSLCQPPSVNINRKLFRNGILQFFFLKKNSFTFYVEVFSHPPPKRSLDIAIGI